jgi:hypothetical protein
MLRPCGRGVSAAGLRPAFGERMKNYGGTEVISRTLSLLFVTELRLRDLLHCNSFLLAQGRMRHFRLS